MRSPVRWLIAIVGLAAVLRLFPIWFGLPYPEARPDEETAIGHAVAILGGDLNPHFFHWPSLTFYVLAAAFWLASLAKRAVSLAPALTFEQQTIIARAVVALAGTATVIVLYRIGRRLADEATGVLAALFLAVAVLHVRDSHFAMTDVLMTLLLTIALAALLRARDERSTTWFAVAGLAGGLAASTKYSAAAIVVSLVMVEGQRLAAGGRTWEGRAWLPSFAFVVLFAAGFVLGTPYAVLDYNAFIADLLYDFTHLSGGHANVNLGRGWLYHLTHSLPYGTGVSIFIAAVAGLVPMARHHARGALVVLAFGAAFYLAIGSGQTVFFRYILPLVPIVCLAAAVAVCHAATALARRSRLSHAAALALFVVVVATPPLVASAWLDVLLARTDTRVLAGEWLNARLQPEDSFYDAGNFYTRLVVSAPASRWTYAWTTNAFAEDPSRTPDWLVLYASPVRAYASVPAGLRTLATTRYELVHTVRATRGRASLAVYDQQDAFFLPFSRFNTVERPGPTVMIYRRRD